jgi:hypothetical protein
MRSSVNWIREPLADGLQRIHNASRELSKAREEMVEAQVRLNAFVAEGLVPDILRKDMQREERSGEVKKKSSGQ